MFVAEFVVAGDGVFGNTNDCGTSVGKLTCHTGKGNRLFGAARGVIAWIKEQHNRTGAQRRQGHFIATIAGQGEIRGGLANICHNTCVPCD